MARQLPLLAAFVCSACSSGPRASVVEVHADVEHGGQQLIRGEQLELDEEIIAGRGYAVLAVGRIGTVRVLPGSRIRFIDRSDRLTVRLVAGSVWALVTSIGSGDRFEVETSNAVAGVRGTELIVETDEETNATEVKVLRGEVSVRGADHDDERLLRTGQRTTVESGAPPSEPIAYDARADHRRWRRVQLQIEGATRGLDKGLRDAKKGIRELLKQR